MSKTRCEPPRPWIKGWHWLETNGRECCAYWWQTLENDWQWAGPGMTPDGRFCTYLAPAAPPAVVAALVAALEGLDGVRDTVLQAIGSVRPPDFDRMTHRLDAARSALAAYRGQA